MNKGNKTNIQLVIGELMKGKSLTSGDICKMVTERELSVKDVSSLLSKISNPNRCDLGHFIEKKQGGASFLYNVVEEALKMSEAQVYGLTLKTGEAKYALAQAFQDYPKLRKYVGSAAESKKAAGKPKPKKAAAGKAAKPKKAAEKAAKPKKAAEKAAKPKKAAEKVAKPKKAAEKAAKPKKPVAEKPAPMPVKKEPAKPADDKSADKVTAGIIKKIADGDLNINLKISLKLDD